MRKKKFGELEGRSVDAVTLESADAAVTILSFGCVTQDWRVDGPAGSLPMVLGFPVFESYLTASRSHGAIVGRIANRTKDARFDFDGRTWELTPNHGPGLRHHIHGGAIGLGKRNWAMETDGAAGTVLLSYRSPDGEEGYPGAVDFTVTFRLDGPALTCEMRGVPDRPTPINLASHTYYNLGGGGSVRDHTLFVDGAEITVLDAESIPTGEIRAVEGTRYDFLEPREIEASDPGREGLDINYVLRPGRDQSTPAGWARCPRTGMMIRVFTDQPGLQIFDAPTMTVAAPGHGGEQYLPYAGLCFEAQHFPDTMHHPDWPGIVATPEAPYFQRLAVEIARG
ncbi:aldose epimerase family protein [Amaricoccus solimangrovi]|uniref:Galactose mutarotase n=1 Tax=Amaricoccus solimangrovi TaxID=2589815 RepID=A0A501X0W6_9RHOB|nr:aldose epimerase family protein [Amaricoccus solimangrovi]TPE53701.1 galactose mutarotase [Amaricoccus solimangrovi]